MVEVETEEKPDTECPAEEPRADLAEPHDEVEPESGEKKKKRIDADKVMELKGKGYTYRMIAQQIGCSEW